MDFRTEFKLEPFERKITYKDKLLFIGSCFAENISNYFSQYRFQTVTNPFGILYHPLAIARLIEIALDENYNPEEYSFEENELWSNFDVHSSFSSTKREILYENLVKAKSITYQALQDSSVIFISLGTAFVYQYIENNKVVANCHKLPQKYFEKRILEMSTVIFALESIVSKIHQVNSNAEIIFTLSPVRHLKDGFIENQLSKSTLHLAIQDTVKNHDRVNYFPSYELLLDDLRDYRFYTSDFLHPNDLALDYIWEKLKNALFNHKTLEILQQVNNINKRLSHRFFNPESPESQIFKVKTNKLINEIIHKYPFIQF